MSTTSTRVATAFIPAAFFFITGCAAFAPDEAEPTWYRTVYTLHNDGTRTVKQSKITRAQQIAEQAQFNEYAALLAAGLGSSSQALCDHNYESDHICEYDNCGTAGMTWYDDTNLAGDEVCVVQDGGSGTLAALMSTFCFDGINQDESCDASAGYPNAPVLSFQSNSFTGSFFTSTVGNSCSEQCGSGFSSNTTVDDTSVGSCVYKSTMIQLNSTTCSPG